MLRSIVYAVSALALTALSAALSAEPANNPAKGGPNAGVEQVLDKAFTEMMRPGPVDTNWNTGGVDLHALVAAAPGGAARNYILTIDKDGARTVTISGVTDPAGLVPANWAPGIRAESKILEGKPADLTFGHLDGQSYFVGTQARQQVGAAYCSVGGMVGALYTDPNSPTKSEIPKDFVEAMFAVMVKRFEKQRMCWRYDRDGDDYRVSHFLDGGQSLPALDAAGYRARIIGAAPIDQLLSASTGK